MELVVIVIVVILGFVFYKKNERRSIEEQLEKQNNLDLVSSVTSLFRGTVSEKYLILTLLKCD